MGTGKRKAGEERKQVTNFEGVVCCPSAAVQGAAQEKIDGSTWDPWEGQQPFRPNPNWSGTAPPC